MNLLGWSFAVPLQVWESEGAEDLCGGIVVVCSRFEPIKLYLDEVMDNGSHGYFWHKPKIDSFLLDPEGYLPAMVVLTHSDELRASLLVA